MSDTNADDLTVRTAGSSAHARNFLAGHARRPKMVAEGSLSPSAMPRAFASALVFAAALAGGFGAGGGGFPGVARAADAADSRDTIVKKARQHFQDGKKAFEARDYAGALKVFQAGYEIEPRPGFLLNMGHAARTMGDLQKARGYYQQFLQTSPSAEERAIAEQSVAEIDRKLAENSGAGAPAAAGETPATTPAPAAVTPAPVAATAATAPTTSQVPPVSCPLSSAMAFGPPPLPPAAEPAQPVGSSMLVAPATPYHADDGGDAVYKKWWFWTGIGAVAVGAAVLLLVVSSGSASAHDSGTWGAVNL